MRTAFIVFLLGSFLSIFQPAHANSPAVDPVSEVQESIISVVAREGNFSTFLDLLATAGLTDSLMRDGPYTVFAPTNEAFATHLYDTSVEDLKKPENAQRLRDILLHHLVRDRITRADIDGNKIFETEDNVTINIMPRGDEIHINQAKIISADIAASNGVIHAIDNVLIPISH